MTGRAAWGAVLLGLLVGAGLGAAEEPVIYKWVDQNGIAHYTTDAERIPRGLRDRVRALGRAGDDARPARGADPWVDRDAAPDSPAPGVPSSASAPGPVGAGAAPAELDARIASLEAEIAREEERLKGLISDPARADQGVLADDPEFRAVAGRLPELQAELRELRARRAELAPPAP